MTNKRSHVMKNGIIVTAVGTVLGGLILHFVPQFSGFFPTLMSWALTGISSVSVVLLSDLSVPIWIFLIIGLFAVVGFVTVCVIMYMALWSRNKSAYVNYTEDMIYGAKWRWSWIKGKLSNLWCFCPNCDAQLVYMEDYGKTHFLMRTMSSQ